MECLFFTYYYFYKLQYKCIILLLQLSTLPVKVIPNLLGWLFWTGPLKISLVLAYFSVKDGQGYAFITSKSWEGSSLHLSSHIHLGTELCSSHHLNSPPKQTLAIPTVLSLSRTPSLLDWRQALMSAVASHPAASLSPVPPPTGSHLLCVGYCPRPGGTSGEKMELAF